MSAHRVRIFNSQRTFENPAIGFSKTQEKMKKERNVPDSFSKLKLVFSFGISKIESEPNNCWETIWLDFERLEKLTSCKTEYFQ